MLEWRRVGQVHEAHFNGRIRWSVQREQRGWFLYRYRHVGKGGQPVFSSKERVKNLTEGKAYAENLHRLANHPASAGAVESRGEEDEAQDLDC